MKSTLKDVVGGGYAIIYLEVIQWYLRHVLRADAGAASFVCMSRDSWNAMRFRDHSIGGYFRYAEAREQYPAANALALLVFSREGRGVPLKMRSIIGYVTCAAIDEYVRDALLFKPLPRPARAISASNATFQNAIARHYQAKHGMNDAAMRFAEHDAGAAEPAFPEDATVVLIAPCCIEMEIARIVLTKEMQEFMLHLMAAASAKQQVPEAGIPDERVAYLNSIVAAATVIVGSWTNEQRLDFIKLVDKGMPRIPTFEELRGIAGAADDDPIFKRMLPLYNEMRAHVALASYNRLQALTTDPLPWNDFFDSLAITTATNAKVIVDGFVSFLRVYFDTLVPQS